MSNDPLMFSNKMIHLLIKQIGSDDIVVNPEDYTAIRVAFRKSGGSWEGFSSGGPQQINLLKEVVKSWCNMPERKRYSDQVV